MQSFIWIFIISAPSTAFGFTFSRIWIARTWDNTLVAAFERAAGRLALNFTSHVTRSAQTTSRILWLFKGSKYTHGLTSVCAVLGRRHVHTSRALHRNYLTLARGAPICDRIILELLLPISKPSCTDARLNQIFGSPRFIPSTSFICLSTRILPDYQDCLTRN